MLKGGCAENSTRFFWMFISYLKFKQKMIMFNYRVFFHLVTSEAGQGLAL